MAILEILKYPNQNLKKKALPVERIDQHVSCLAQDMADTMYAAPGVGLAAPQVGYPLRLVVVDITPANQPKNLMVFVNPEIVDFDGECTWEEGCLSVPDITVEVKRKKKVVVRYQDLEGATKEIAGDDLLAIVLQHEIDHLDGILFIDYLSQLKRSLYRRQLQQEKKEGKKL